MNGFQQLLTDHEFCRQQAEDEFLHGCARMFRARARLLQWLALVLIVATFVVIGIGIYIFQAGDPNESILATEELQVIGDLQKVRGELAEMDAKDAEVTQRANTLRRASLLADRLGALKGATASFADAPNKADGDRLERLLRICRLILTACESLPAGETVIDITAFEPHDSSRFSKDVFVALQSALGKAGINIADESKLADRLLVPLEAMMMTEEVEGKFQGPPVERFEDTANKVVGTLQKLESVMIESKGMSKAAELEVQRMLSVASERAAKRTAASRKERELTEKLNEARARRDKVLVMAWLPGLTLRVGAVILLLFLTQILLSTYRYTMSLSSFYLARGDVMMLAERTDGKTIQQLSEILTPGTLHIESVKDPTDHIAGLASAWLARK